jgi:hypothetical protein
LCKSNPDPADNGTHEQTRADTDADGSERPALHIMRRFLAEVFQRFDTTSSYAPNGTLCGVDAFLAGIPGH